MYSTFKCVFFSPPPRSLPHEDLNRFNRLKLCLGSGKQSENIQETPKLLFFFNDWDTLVKKTPVKSDYVLLEICSNPRKRTRSFFLDISCRPGGLKNTP